MTASDGGPQLVGLLGAAGRLVAPERIIAGRATGLLGVLWFTGGVWVLLGSALGVYSDGYGPGMLGLAVVALVVGSGLLLVRERVLPPFAPVGLTLAGSLVIALGTLWAGPSGFAVTGMLYVYVTSFAFVSLPERAAIVTGLSSAMHLFALLAGGAPSAAAIWLITWGIATVTGVIVGAAVEWLRQLVRRLEEADRQRTRIVATISHDLRTPLTAIVGFATVLATEWDRVDEPTRQRFVQVIARQSTRLRRLVEDVLTMSALLRDTITPAVQEVDVDRVIARVLETLTFDVVVQSERPVTALVDPGHLERILDNLLVNADRYGAQPIVLRVRRAAGEVEIDVVDHGAGIDGGFSDHLLEPFVQGDHNGDRGQVGIGLGLAICRDLLAANGGRLSYEDTPGGGATVRLVIPAAEGAYAQG